MAPYHLAHAKRRKGKRRSKPAGFAEQVWPEPITVVQVNCGSANGWSEKRSLEILAAAAELGDIMFACELSNVTTDFPLDPLAWDWEHDPTTPALAGSLLAISRTRGRVHWAEHKVGVLARFGIRTRHIITARLAIDETGAEWFPKVTASHLPPKRAWGRRFENWLSMAASIRKRHADIDGADFNRLPPAVEKALGKQTRMCGIVGFALAEWIPASRARAVDVGGDHPAVVVTLFPKGKR